MLALLRKQELVELKELRNPALFKVFKWRINCLLSNIFFTWSVVQLCKRYDSEFIYQRYSPLNIVGVLVKHWVGRKLVLEYNGSEVWVDNHWSTAGWLTKKVYRWLLMRTELINIMHADHIVVVSQALKDELMGRGVEGARIIVNPNGVHAHLLDAQKLEDRRNAVRDALGIQATSVIGFVGTFSVWHGIQTIQAMIPRVAQRHPDVHFLLIGDGPLLQTIKQSIAQADIPADRVTLTGLLSHEQALDYLAACDLFLCPTQPNPDGTRFFGSPTKLFEYMSLAKPVIASDIEQLADVISPAIKMTETDSVMAPPSATGVLVRPDDTQGFVAAVSLVLSMEDRERKQLGANAREKIVKHYTWRQHTQKIIDAVMY
jgi:glycosyltransferase involved in cell wall biosynthesis